MISSTILGTCLLVAIFLEITSGRFLVEDFPVNLTCVSHVPLTTWPQITFQCAWLPPHNDSFGNCSLFYRATDEFSFWGNCKSLAEWNLCDVLQDGPINCKVPQDHCAFEYLSLMLHCENDVVNFSSPEFSMDEIVIPNPPSGLHLVANGKKRMSLSWQWPNDWSKHDLHSLQFYMKYWQEVRGKQLSSKVIVIDVEHVASDIPPWDLSGLQYSYVNTCVQMSSVYKFNVQSHSSDWSAVVCNRTQIERPIGQPENLTAMTIYYNDKRRTRTVNVSWSPIPETQQGGPILYYEVTIGSAIHNVSGCFIVFYELNTTHSYDIMVAAWNAEGSSRYATFLLRRLQSLNKVPAIGMLIGVAVCATGILIIIISSLLVLKRKLRKGNNIEFELSVAIPDKLDLSHKNIFNTEKEVFDSLREKKESNNNENTESRIDSKKKSFQEEEYQPFIVEKKGLKTSHQVESTGYVDADDEIISDRKIRADLKAKNVCDGNTIVDLISENMSDGMVDVVLDTVDDKNRSKHQAEDMDPYVRL